MQREEKKLSPSFNFSDHFRKNREFHFGEKYNNEEMRLMGKNNNNQDDQVKSEQDYQYQDHTGGENEQYLNHQDEESIIGMQKQQSQPKEKIINKQTMKKIQNLVGEIMKRKKQPIRGEEQQIQKAYNQLQEIMSDIPIDEYSDNSLSDKGNQNKKYRAKTNENNSNYNSQSKNDRIYPKQRKQIALKRAAKPARNQQLFMSSVNKMLQNGLIQQNQNDMIQKAPSYSRIDNDQFVKQEPDINSFQTFQQQNMSTSKSQPFPVQTSSLQNQKTLNPSMKSTRGPKPSKQQQKNSYVQPAFKNVPTTNPISMQNYSQQTARNSRDNLQREIATLFITKGYGLSMAKACTSQPLDGNRYNSILTSIIKGGLRKLCDIMNRNLNQNVKPFTSPEQKLLRSPLVNCRKWLLRNQLQAFLKIIKIIYGINQQPICQDEVFALYEKILKQLGKRRDVYKDREKEKGESKPLPPSARVMYCNKFQNVANPALLQSNNIPNSQKMQTNHNIVSMLSHKIPRQNEAQHTSNNEYQNNFAQRRPNESKPSHQANSSSNNDSNLQNTGIVMYEREIVDLYVRFKNEETIFLILSKKYKEYNWRQQELSATLQKLVKIGLKKILKFRKELLSKNGSIPPLNLNQQIVSNIIHFQNGLQTRVIILKSLLQNNLTLQRIIHLINVINHFIRQI